MHLSRFQFIPYTLKTVHPVSLTSHSFSIKKGHLVIINIHISTHQNKTIAAEVPALPSVHPLSTKESCNELAKILNTLKNRILPTQLKWEQPTFGVLPTTATLPTQILFSLESLLLSAYHQQFLDDFHLPASFKIPINRLFIPDSSEPDDSNIQTLKIKTSNLKKPLLLIQKLLQQNPRLQLRLDPNRTMTPSQLESLVKYIPKRNLEYIEDPYPHLHQGLAVFNHFPLALDKELTHALQDKNIPQNVVALVVKPSRDLSLSGVISLLQQKKFKIVISSPYETPVGLWPLAHLSAITKTPAGLDVQKFFQVSKTIPFHPTTNNHLHISENYQKQLTDRLITLQN